MVAVEGEAMRPVTWVRVQEIESGEWAIGGNPLTASDVKAMAAAKSGGLSPTPARAPPGGGPGDGPSAPAKTANELPKAMTRQPTPTAESGYASYMTADIEVTDYDMGQQYRG